MNEEIRYFPAAGEGKPLHIQMAGVSHCDGSYHIVRRFSDVTVIEYVLEGEGYISAGGREGMVSADDIYILPLHTAHDYASSAENPMEKIFINLAGPLPALLLEQYGLTGRLVFDGRGLRPLFERTAALVRREGAPEQDEAALAALFFEIVLRLGRQTEREKHPEEALRLKEYLDRSADRIVGNRELASQIFRSPDYCVKLFGREFGITPYEYQLRGKMRAACRLLQDTALPVSAVAAAVGYGDPRYFSGLFKKKCGVSPRDWRRGKRPATQKDWVTAAP